MIFELNDDFVETNKAVQITLHFNSTEKKIWIPKSQITNIKTWKNSDPDGKRRIIVTQWFYDKIIDENFLK